MDMNGKQLQTGEYAIPVTEMEIKMLTKQSNTDPWWKIILL